MKKIILIAGICFVSLLGAQAQQTTAKAASTFDQKVDRMMKTLTATCNLTPDQVTKARPIVAETIKAHTANKQQYGSDKDKLKAANKSTLAAENVKMNAILNADQQQKLADFEKQREASAQKKQATAGNQQ